MPIDHNKLGQLRTQVGRVKGKQLRFLGQVGDCLKDACPIKDICPYEPKGRCTHVYSFLSSLYRGWVDPVDGLGDVLTQDQMDRLGIHLMPLYHQLIRFQIETCNLTEMTYETKTGIQNEYPQYKAIREVIHQIRAELKELQLGKLWKQKFGEEKLPPSPGLDMRDGKPGAYEEMVKRAKKVKEE